MPAVSLPPKENALFKRILVSVRLRASSGEGLAGNRACHPSPRPGGHRATSARHPAFAVPARPSAARRPFPESPAAARAPGTPGVPFPSPRVGGPGSGLGPGPASRLRFSLPPRAKGGAARRAARAQPRPGGAGLLRVGQARVGPLEGTGGAGAARLIHCPRAVLPPSSVPPSSSPGIHLSPPDPGSLSDPG
jgi:hypothetical protein